MYREVRVQRVNTPALFDVCAHDFDIFSGPLITSKLLPVSSKAARVRTRQACALRTMPTLPNFLRSALRALRSRLFRNLLFWAYIAYNVFGNTAPEHKQPARYYFAFVAVTAVLMVAMTYANNLWLVPRFLAKRHYWIYFPAVFLLAGITAVLYTLAIKASLPHFPVLEIQQVSMIHSPVTGNWSAAGILADTESYWGGFIIWLAFFTAAWYITEFARLARTAREARARQTALELSALKSQLHPHFLFNTLNNLYGLASIGSEKTPGAILQLSALLRYLLYDSAVDAVRFGAEEEAIHAYVELERLRLDDTAEVDVQTLGPADALLPPLLWLPVLENAFKHGTQFIGGPYAIRFSMELEGRALRIACSNRYKPVESRPGAVSSGIGLANLRQRLHILFPGRHSLDVQTEGDQFSVLLTATLSTA